jgi:hypothetical protein
MLDIWQGKDGIINQVFKYVFKYVGKTADYVRSFDRALLFACFKSGQCDIHSSQLTAAAY